MKMKKKVFFGKMHLILPFWEWSNKRKQQKIILKGNILEK